MLLVPCTPCMAPGQQTQHSAPVALTSGGSGVYMCVCVYKAVECKTVSILQPYRASSMIAAAISHPHFKLCCHHWNSNHLCFCILLYSWVFLFLQCSISVARGRREDGLLLGWVIFGEQGHPSTACRTQKHYRNIQQCNSLPLTLTLSFKAFTSFY